MIFLFDLIKCVILFKGISFLFVFYKIYITIILFLINNQQMLNKHLLTA